MEWPEGEEYAPPEDAKYIIEALLVQHPLERLGSGGSSEIKDNPFFNFLNWDSLLRQKAEFVPQLDNEDDTSYFDSKSGDVVRGGVHLIFITKFLDIA